MRSLSNWLLFGDKIVNYDSSCLCVFVIAFFLLSSLAVICKINFCFNHGIKDYTILIIITKNVATTYENFKYEE